MTTIVCLGDSITEGEGDSNHMGWVGRLNAYMQCVEPGQHIIYNLGIGGDTLSGAYHRYYSEALLRRPDIVIIAIGTNDCQRTGDASPQTLRSSLPHAEYQWNKWTKYLCAGLHKTVVIGLLPTDESRMPYINAGRPNNWVLNRDLLAYNEMLCGFCARNNIPFINLWNKWTPAMCKTHMTDGVHPNDKGYDFIFEIIKGCLEHGLNR